MLFSFRYKLILNHVMVALISAMFLTACGGDSSGSNATKEAALEKIKIYAQSDSNPVPTVQDYIDAGVTGIGSENLLEMNNVVKGLSSEDVDTTEELEELTAQLNINILPTANAGPDKTTQINTNVTITGSASDSDGTIASYQWKKGGTVLSTAVTFSYAPTAVGMDTLTLLVTDNDGGTASDTMTVTVTAIPNVAPTADAGADKTVRVNNAITITGSGSDSDGTIASFKWEQGSALLSSNASFNFIPSVVGTSILTLTVTDDDGATGTDEVSIVVSANPVPPVANAGEDKKAIVGELITITGSGIDTDGVITSFEWKKEGVVISTNASLDYTPTLKGTDTLTLKVTDNDGYTATDDVNILIGINIADSDKFLTFVNTGNVGAVEINVENELIANTYYSTIDPNQRKDTLEKWYVENCFKAAPAGYVNPPDCGGDIGNHAFAIYLNNVDLNLGRRMALRSNSDQVIGNPVGFLKNTVASCVENYSSIDDAISQTDSIATVCMEYSPAESNINGRKFTKFYTYGPTGARINKVDLDGRGEKYQPDMCLTCHGGTPGTVNAAGATPVYSNEGDTGAGFIPWDLNNFKFHDSNALYSKAAQENEFKKLNQGALQTYEAFDGAGEQAKATRELIRGWYNFTGDTILEDSVFNGSFTPTGWRGQEALYHDVVVPSCRACHIQRGLSSAGTIDFSNSTDFIAYKNTIETLVNKEGTMPLAKRTYDLFWDNLRAGNQADKLWSELGFAGDVAIPGAPIPKISPVIVPDDIDVQKMISLDGRESLFATDYRWEVIQSPPSAVFTLESDTSSVATLKLLNDTSFGNYKFKLTIVNAGGEEAIIESSLINVDTELTFNGNIFPILQGDCFTCHASPSSNPLHPSAFAAFPMSTDMGVTNTEVLSKVDLGSPANSLLLLKATNTSNPDHDGGERFTNTDVRYQTILRWIQQLP